EVEPAIIHRARRNRYRISGTLDSGTRDRTSQELAKLYRLGLDMGAARTAKEISSVVLESLCSETAADIGAILLLPDGTTEPRPEQLQVIAYRSKGEIPYEQVSGYLSRVVIE